MTLLRIDRPIDLIRNGVTHHFKAGDVIAPQEYPGVERLIKEQKKKGRVEKNGLLDDTRHSK